MRVFVCAQFNMGVMCDRLGRIIL